MALTCTFSIRLLFTEACCLVIRWHSNIIVLYLCKYIVNNRNCTISNKHSHASPPTRPTSQQLLSDCPPFIVYLFCLWRAAHQHRVSAKEQPSSQHSCERNDKRRWRTAFGVCNNSPNDPSPTLVMVVRVTRLMESKHLTETIPITQ